MSKTDFNKRSEMVAELVYYLFDSFLIPLIRSNFYVTESSAHRNRLLYFRHDVWRALTGPIINQLKTEMLEEVKFKDVPNVLNSKSLGFSIVRLLPKRLGLRAIANLRRRAQTLQNGRWTAGKSINSAMAPVFHMLNYEKVRMQGSVHVRGRPIRATLTSTSDKSTRSFRSISVLSRRYP